MAELKNDEEEHALPSKRKPLETNPSAEHLTDDELAKKQKLDSLISNSNSSSAATTEQKTPATAYDNDDEEDEEEDYEGEDDADDSDDDEDEDDEAEEPEIDRKGKGIMKDVKGKGKLIEESDDDSSNVASDSDGDGDDSDLSDDPLAEVDLDNILPSRTRRRVVRPGLNISGDGGKDK